MHREDQGSSTTCTIQRLHTLPAPAALSSSTWPQRLRGATTCQSPAAPSSVSVHRRNAPACTRRCHWAVAFDMTCRCRRPRCAAPTLASKRRAMDATIHFLMHTSALLTRRSSILATHTLSPPRPCQLLRFPSHHPTYSSSALTLVPGLRSPSGNECDGDAVLLVLVSRQHLAHPAQQQHA